MDIWDLQVLITVLDSGSISRASTSLGRTQPQISRIIQELEADLGFSLFNRIGRRLAPTPQAQEFAEKAKLVIRQMDYLRDDVRNMRARERAVLRILVPPYIYYGFVPKLLRRLREVLPETQFRLDMPALRDDGKWEVIRDYDIGLAVLPTTVVDATEIAIATLKHALALPAGHPLAERALARPEDLLGQPYIGISTNYGRRVEATLEAHAVHTTNAAITPDLATALALVNAGIGITVANALAASAFTARDAVLVPFPALAPDRFGIFVNPRAMDEQLQALFVTAVRDVLTDFDQRFVELA